MVVVDGQGVPLGGTLASASPAEVKLAEETINTIKVPRKGRGRPKKRPKRIIADKGYDSDNLRIRLSFLGIHLISPYRKNRKNAYKQQDRVMVRYKRRWIVERTFAWLSSFRRLVVRYDRIVTLYRAFFHLACIIVTLRRF
jgi:transposase